MTPSSQTLIEKTKAVLFVGDETQKRKMSMPEAVLPLLATEEPNSDVTNKFHEFRK